MSKERFGGCCFQGVKHEGDTTGVIEPLGDFEVYIKHPENKSPDKAILMLTDAFGHRLTNAQLIADQFAANGYLVMMPDVFYGDAIKMPLDVKNFDGTAWLNGEYCKKGKSHREKDVDPIIETCLAELRNKYNIKRIGAAGYCFGAKYTMRHLRQNQGKIDVGFAAHPGLILEEELEAMDGPIALALAETDEHFPDEMRYKTEETLKRRKLAYQISLYGQVVHGFASRGDVSIPAVKYAKEAAFLQALQFFEEYL